MGTIYLHIGMTRTGTTTIQKFLASNRRLLETYRISFPDFGFSYNHIGYHRNGHFLLEPFRKKDGSVDRNLPSAEYETVLDTLEELGRQYDSIILSDEGIWRDLRVRGDFYRKVKEDFRERGLDLKVILYIRRQDLWIESYWARRVREGMRQDFAKFRSTWRDRYPLDHYAMAKRLWEIFGPDHTFIRIFEKESFRGAEKTLHSDFLDIFGLSPDGFEIGVEVQNKGLRGTYLEIMRTLNAFPKLREKDHPLVKCLIETQYEAGGEQGSFFAPAERDEFMEQFADSNRELALALGIEDGVLFHQKKEDVPQYIPSKEDLLQQTILFYGKTSIYLLDELKRQREGTDQLIQENREWRKRYGQEQRELRENVLLYRLKRKARHLLSKEDAAN